MVKRRPRACPPPTSMQGTGPSTGGTVIYLTANFTRPQPGDGHIGPVLGPRAYNRDASQRTRHRKNTSRSRASGGAAMNLWRRVGVPIALAVLVAGCAAPMQRPGAAPSAPAAE